jgi:UDP-N-acetylglucosamine--N-acetylmuramyl-(pentapeptide) pyrophosphoryl-undecaprenol N-acetylglucosamine transferase
MNTPTALVMAGGTGGHIFPGLAIAEELRGQGWQVHWMGAPHPSMESQLIPPKGFAFEAVRFGGIRGKGKLTLLLMPWRLLVAMVQSLKLIQRVKPDVLVGLGGYITFPGGVMGVVSGRPLVLHEQNAVAGMANQWLAKISCRGADRRKRGGGRIAILTGEGNDKGGGHLPGRVL